MKIYYIISTTSPSLQTATLISKVLFFFDFTLQQFLLGDCTPKTKFETYGVELRNQTLTRWRKKQMLTYSVPKVRVRFLVNNDRSKITGISHLPSTLGLSHTVTFVMAHRHICHGMNSRRCHIEHKRFLARMTTHRSCIKSVRRVIRPPIPAKKNKQCLKCWYLDLWFD